MAVPPFVIKRPTQLIPRTNPVPSEVMASDNGSSVEGVTWADGVNAAVPVASQSDAIAGTDNHRRMTPLTTKQAIDAQVAPKINNAIGDLNLGSASRSDVSDFATAAQGVIADSAVQPGDLAPVAISNSYNDLTDKPTPRLLPAGGLTSQALIKSSDDDYSVEWVSSASSTAVSYAPQSLNNVEKGQALSNLGAGLLSGFRNKLINGDFGIWQRGDTFEIAAGGRLFVADRWGVVNNTDRRILVYKQPAGATVQDIIRGEYCIRLHFDSAPTSGYAYLVQKVEDVRTIFGGMATFTAMMNNSGFTMSGQPQVELVQQFGTGGSAPFLDTRNVVFPSNEWGKVTAAFDIGSIAGKTIGNNNALDVRIRFSPRSVGNLYVARASLVEGNATADGDPFAPRHIQQELDLCYRYYEASANPGYRVLFAGDVTSGNAYFCQRSFRVQKRVAPTMTLSNFYNDGFPSSIGTVGVDVDGFTEFRVASVTGPNKQFQSSWAADAELGI